MALPLLAGAAALGAASQIPGCTHFIRVADDPEEEQSTAPTQVEPTVVEVADRDRSA